jgi:hypothetical protein
MKTFEKMAAQGDMLIRAIDKLPENVKSVDAEAGNFILTHSETGHHHVVKKQEGVSFFQNDNDPLIAYLVVDNKNVRGNVCVEHLRQHDTHESISFFTGDVFAKGADKFKKIFEIRRQREYTPEGFRKAQD